MCEAVAEAGGEDATQEAIGSKVAAVSFHCSLAFSGVLWILSFFILWMRKLSVVLMPFMSQMFDYRFCSESTIAFDLRGRLKGLDCPG